MVRQVPTNLSKDIVDKYLELKREAKAQRVKYNIKSRYDEFHASGTGYVDIYPTGTLDSGYSIFNIVDENTRETFRVSSVVYDVCIKRIREGGDNNDQN